MKLVKFIKFFALSLFLIVIGMIAVPAIDYIIDIYNTSPQVKPVPVSLVQLVANPSEFHEKDIITEGYLKLSNNNLEDRLFIGDNFAKNNMTYNSIAILIKEVNSDEAWRSKMGKIENYNNSYIYIKGKFLLRKIQVEDQVMYEKILLVDWYGHCPHSNAESGSQGELCGPLIIISEESSKN